MWWLENILGNKKQARVLQAPNMIFIPIIFVDLAIAILTKTYAYDLVLLYGEERMCVKVQNLGVYWYSLHENDICSYW